MEQQTMTGSGHYILIAVQLLFSMLILLRIRQYRKKPTGCLPSVLVILSTTVFTSVLYYIWQIVCDERQAVGQTSAECLPQDPGRSGWHGHFSDCSLCCSPLQAAPLLRVCPHGSSPQVLQRNVAEPHRK